MEKRAAAQQGSPAAQGKWRWGVTYHDELPRGYHGKTKDLDSCEEGKRSRKFTTTESGKVFYGMNVVCKEEKAGAGLAGAILELRFRGLSLRCTCRGRVAKTTKARSHERSPCVLTVR